MKTDKKGITIRKNSFKNLKISCVLLIFIFCSILQVNAQSPNAYDYGAKYKVKIGDSNEYRYTAVNNAGKNYLTSYLRSDNGSYLPVNITTSTTITVTVMKINQSTSGIDQVFGQIKFNNPGHSVITSNDNLVLNYLMPAFDNVSFVKKYISDLNRYISSYISNQKNYPYLIYVQYSVEGDYFKYDYSYNFSTSLITYKIALNWKTGWLEYNQAKQVAKNGTLMINYKLERVSNNLLIDIIDYSITGLTIVTIATVVIVLMFTYYSYRKFSKSPKVANKNISFSQYIKSKGKKNPSKKIYSPTQSTRALDMIDEILKENK